MVYAFCRRAPVHCCRGMVVVCGMRFSLEILNECATATPAADNKLIEGVATLGAVDHEDVLSSTGSSVVKSYAGASMTII